MGWSLKEGKCTLAPRWKKDNCSQLSNLGGDQEIVWGCSCKRDQNKCGGVCPSHEVGIKAVGVNLRFLWEKRWRSLCLWGIWSGKSFFTHIPSLSWGSLNAEDKKELYLSALIIKHALLKTSWEVLANNHRIFRVGKDL